MGSHWRAHELCWSNVPARPFRREAPQGCGHVRAPMRGSFMGHLGRPVEPLLPGPACAITCTGSCSRAPQDRPVLRQEQGLFAWPVPATWVVVIAAVCHRLRAFFTRAAACVKATLRRLTRPSPLINQVAGDLLRTRRELIAENALLSQRLIVASRQVKRAPIPGARTRPARSAVSGGPSLARHRAGWASS